MKVLVDAETKEILGEAESIPIKLGELKPLDGES